ncbi:MAG: hypothetical protein MHPSP_001902 [Paramarteilia canceri]
MRGTKSYGSTKKNKATGSNRFKSKQVHKKLYMDQRRDEIIGCAENKITVIQTDKFDETLPGAGRYFCRSCSYL